MTPVASRIVNDVSYATDINHVNDGSYVSRINHECRFVVQCSTGVARCSTVYYRVVLCSTE